MIIGVGLFNVLNAHSSQLNWSFAKVRAKSCSDSLFRACGKRGCVFVFVVELDD
jgi:hypothetical protein